jgi:hypothetical protein
MAWGSKDPRLFLYAAYKRCFQTQDTICQLSLSLPMEQAGYNNVPIPNDGLVPVSSVESQGYFHSLGHTNSCDTNLLSDYEYGLARDTLLGK